jgi:aminopeptidase
VTRLEPTELELRVADAVELAHRVSDRLAHPLHLVPSSLVQDELDTARPRAATHDAHARRRRQAVLELDAGTKPCQLVGRRRPLDVGLVHLRNSVPRVREPVREVAVVRQQQGAGRVHVEASDRNDSRLGRHEVDDRLPSVRIAGGCDNTCRLVEEDVREPLRCDALAVHLDDVPLSNDRVQLARLAVDAHSPFLDQLVRTAPRSDPGAREVGIEAHDPILARVARVTRIETLSDSLAQLAVYGANVQPGQLVAITSYIGKEDVTRRIARAAYERGAKYVDVIYFDQWLKRERVALAAEDTLGYVPPWMTDRLLYLSDEHAARVSLSGPHAPRALEGLDPARAGLDLLPYLPETGEVVNRMTTSWCIVPVPTTAWAALVYPDLDAEAALEQLWEDVAHICRLDEEDPSAAWMERSKALKTNARRLTDQRYDALRLRGSGTDLTIGLFASAHWAAGDLETVDGRRHSPNLPTEEVFGTPDPARVDGYVSATMPLELSGSIIENIRVEFEGGRAVKIDADSGVEVLRAVATRDDGASRLGEIALVDGEGRIGALGRVFYDTLIDENAASHIALGDGYEHPVEDPAEKARINKSKVHVDFIIGSAELDVDGITRDGQTVPVLRNGAWQI